MRDTWNKIIKKRIFGLLLLCLLLPGQQALAMEEGEYSVSVDISGGSGKAAVTSPTLLTVREGTAYARIQWSSPNYDYMIVDGAYYYDQEMEVIADTTAMGHPVEVRYQLLFYHDSVGSKHELPQEAAKRVLLTAFAIIVVGGILNYFVKKRNS